MPAPTGSRPAPEFLGQVHKALLASSDPIQASEVAAQLGRPRMVTSVKRALRELGDLGLAERSSSGWQGIKGSMRGNTPPPRSRELTVELFPSEDASDPATAVEADELDAWAQRLSRAAQRALSEHVSGHDWARLRELIRP